MINVSGSLMHDVFIYKVRTLPTLVLPARRVIYFTMTTIKFGEVRII